MFTTPKSLYEFCYFCDEILEKKTKNHICVKPLNSLSNIHKKLFQIQKLFEHNNIKAFDIFLFNIKQPEITLEELIHNVKVLKQAVDYSYSPIEEILRLRLLNIIGKKIALLL